MRKSFVTACSFIVCAACASARDCQPVWTAPPGSLEPLATNHMVAFDDGSGPALWIAGSRGVYRVQNGVTTLSLNRFGFHRMRAIQLGVETQLYACGASGVFRRDGGAWTYLGGTDIYDIVAADLGDGPQLYCCDVGTVRRVGVLGSIGAFDGTCGPTSLAVFPDASGAPQLYFAGRFDRRSDDPEHYHSIARWDGSAWHTVGGGVLTTQTLPCGAVENPSGYISTLAVVDDGAGPRLFACGAFERAGDVPVQSVAIWDGTSWSGVGPISPGAPAFVRDLIPRLEGPDFVLYACGNFHDFGGIPATGVARWDGTAWTAPFSGIQLQNRDLVSGVTRFEGDWYLGGKVTHLDSLDDVPLARLACICPDLDQSGTVDLGDLAQVVAEFGRRRSTSASGDADGDGYVDLGDLSLVLGYFGQRCP